MLNRRELERLKEKWWSRNPERKECEKADDQSDGISIENIGGVFIVIFVGIGLACITLAFEYWWYKYRKGGTNNVIDVQEAPSQSQATNFPPQQPANTVNKSIFPKNLGLGGFRKSKNPETSVKKLYPRSRF